MRANGKPCGGILNADRPAVSDTFASSRNRTTAHTISHVNSSSSAATISQTLFPSDIQSEKSSSARLGSFILFGLGASPSASSTTAIPKATSRATMSFYTGINANKTLTHAASAGITSAPSLNTRPNPLGNAIPGLFTSSCEPAGGCVAICSNNNTACLKTASSLANICESSWDSYNSIAYGGESTPSGWHYYTALEGEKPYTSTSTVEVYTEFSTSNATFVKQVATPYGKLTTITPVYAIGTPSPSIAVTSWTQSQSLYSYLTGPVPTCKWRYVTEQSQCGQCTLTGGTVQLYYWPPTASGTITSPYTTVSTVLDGTTLYSPTVYISLESVHAGNSCYRVGSNHTRTMISLNPTDVTTQIHVGGKVAQSGANTYGQLNYDDLTGLPPATQYELQPSCIMFGCPTIYPSSSWDPTLVVPTQLRSIDPAWGNCAVGLDGLYV